MTNKQINNSKSLFGTPLKNYAKGKKEEKKSINQSIKLYLFSQFDWLSASPNFV